MTSTLPSQVGAPNPQPTKNRVCRYFSKTGNFVVTRDIIRRHKGSRFEDSIIVQGLELIGSTGSCRDGDKCSFVHNDPPAPGSRATTSTSEMAEASTSAIVVGEDGMIQDRRQATNKPVPASRVVSRPVPQAATQDPREFQLGQIRRRFNPKESKLAKNQMVFGVEDGTSLLQFKMTPSDPDFPFEMAALEVSLLVPPSYPKSQPTIKVGNKDIPTGFSYNIESGFQGLIEEKPTATLLDLMKALDKNLEVFLSAPPAETVKIIANKDTRHLTALPSRSVESPSGSGASGSVSSSVTEKATTPSKPVQNFSTQQKTEAAKRRELETRQLEARMGRLPLYRRSGDEIAYTIPIEPKKRSELPIALQAIKTVQLFVPLLYPLEPCRVQLEGVDSKEAKPVEKGFGEKAAEKQEAALMVHINYLAQNMHALAKTIVETENKTIPAPADPETEKEVVEKGKQLEGHQDAERSHIQYIARPPEWNVIDEDDFSDTDTDDLYSYDTGDESSDREGGAEVAAKDQESTSLPAPAQEKGTAMSFPFIELYGIEILEVTILNLTVKCERCKEVTEVKGLKDGATKVERCKKCATPLHVGFRKDLVHAHAVRAGFLDFEGCVVFDLLPSTFTPTCSQCSTAYPSPGIVSVRGDTTSNVCRECHQKFTFMIPQVKFLRITSSHMLSAPAPRRKKETLGLVAGSELPKRGRCRHYAKSFRWFRFSCCQKVYACDKCHDEGEDHHNEWANRMVCGLCSREQNYRPEDCAICHSSVTGRKGGGGFWEGGKGTRDRVKMSRKDPRKYRNRREGGGSKPKAS